MTKFLYLIFSFTTLMSFKSFGQDPWYERRNGGYAIECASTPLQILDIQEGQTVQGFKLDTNASEDLDQRMDYLFTKLARLSTYRAEMYRGWYAEFFRNTQFVEHLSGAHPNDVGTVVLPKGCSFNSLKLVAVQRARSESTGPFLTIDSSLWNRLNVINKAALIMHELIYREVLAVDKLQVTSESVRKFNTLLQGQGFDSLTTKGLFDFLAQNQFGRAEFAGITVILGYRDNNFRWIPFSYSFYDELQLREASYIPSESFQPSTSFPRPDGSDRGPVFSQVTAGAHVNKITISPDGLIDMNGANSSACESGSCSRP